MGEEIPIELRPKFNFRVIDTSTGDIVETLLDIQWPYAMARLTELQQEDAENNNSRELDVVRFTTDGEQSV
jgi:hypothetical protein